MRNVVLLCLDTVRKDYFDQYAPRLRDRADVVYDQCRSVSSWSVSSHASMFTGKLPSDNGIHAYRRDFSGLARKDTFMRALEDHRTLGISANVWASSAFGFDGMFDSFSDVSPDRRFPEGIHVGQFGQNCEREGLGKQIAFLRAALSHDHPIQSLANGALVQFDDVTARLPLPKPLDDGAKSITRRAQSMIKNGSEPFFLFANLMDAHGPVRHIVGFDPDLHDAPLDWTSETESWGDVLDAGNETLIERYRGLYGASIDYLDRVVCSFIDAVQAATDRETTFVITSDHGDNLRHDGDDEQWGHIRSSLSEALLHVPQVVVNAPESIGQVPDYISHLSLGDLIVGLSNGEVPDVCRERIPAERAGYSGKLHRMDEVSEEKNRALRCVYEGDRKYVWDGNRGKEVYRLDADRASWEERVDEEFNIEPYESELFSGPLSAFAERLGDGSATPDVDAATEDRLRDLGYM
ncbi:sulfatase-like hydrolase/transferase [Halobellus ordinarius]|uniref:sulfatase-like hydrolase/transferase n=1 Tax=Halobellus ordinarius TaxID=3075120 RepID=UPI00288007BA|nr:sulfatase-like hydrolase/transferase [Halobellus sp. ZY16]